MVGARLLSSLINYFINCKLVFEHRSLASIIRYYLLVAGILAINYGMLYVTTQWIALPVAKIIVEVILYPLSFYIQRKYVFPPESEDIGADK